MEIEALDGKFVHNDSDRRYFQNSYSGVIPLLDEVKIDQDSETMPLDTSMIDPDMFYYPESSLNHPDLEWRQVHPGPQYIHEVTWIVEVY